MSDFSSWEKSDRQAWLKAFLVSLAVFSPFFIIMVILFFNTVIIVVMIFLEIYFASMSASILKDYFKAKFKRCPLIKTCPQTITEKYFKTYCNSRDYIFCHYLPKPEPKPPKFMTPLRWLHLEQKVEKKNE